MECIRRVKPRIYSKKFVIYLPQIAHAVTLRLIKLGKCLEVLFSLGPSKIDGSTPYRSQIQEIQCKNKSTSNVWHASTYI
jgi:hypothetical protein